VFAAAGSDAQRRWCTNGSARTPEPTWSWVVARPTTPPSTTHLGALAAALGDTAAAEAHFPAAWPCTSGWEPPGGPASRRQALAGLQGRGAGPGGQRTATGARRAAALLGGRQVRLPDSKGLADIAALVRAGGGRRARPHPGRAPPSPGWVPTPVLDRQAKAAYQARLAGLAADIEDAEAAGSDGRAEALRSERDALIRELAAAAGLGHRDRRLGDEAERARKTVSARVRDALAKIGQVPPRTGRAPARIAADGNPGVPTRPPTHPVDGELSRGVKPRFPGRSSLATRT